MPVTYINVDAYYSLYFYAYLKILIWKQRSLGNLMIIQVWVYTVGKISKMIDSTVSLFSKLFLWHLDLAWKKPKSKNYCSSIVLLNLLTWQRTWKPILDDEPFTYQVDHAIISEKISTTSDDFKVKICSCYHFKDILIIYVLTVSSLKLPIFN